MDEASDATGARGLAGMAEAGVAAAIAARAKAPKRVDVEINFKEATPFSDSAGPMRATLVELHLKVSRGLAFFEITASFQRRFPLAEGGLIEAVISRAPLAFARDMVKARPMLSAIILVPTDPVSKTHPFGPLLRTLAALVPVTIEGTVRDVTLLRIGESPDVANIANEAGCGVVQAGDFGTGLGRSLAGAKTSWICLIQAGTIPGPTFGEDVAAALDDAGASDRALLLRSGGGALARYFPFLSTVAGVIAPKARLSAGACASFADVVRNARPARSLPSSVAFL